ncbi:MAG: UDP-N-acetylmuramoyl-tripeptide--D-alanyl-D-alanine ligase [Bacteroidetes bacterium]|nr:UDP-N-acetylmuramoyl-tripeptide--D-alanyl-D-alanine ligase [Bacteroidota bacterium]
MKFPEISKLYSLFRDFPQVVTDSRKATSNSIFFALKGENFNGNQFAEIALNQGCAYAVIDEEKFYKGERYILVNDSLKTLQELAKFHRGKLKIPFIAITGSNGKTTTKELIKSVLSKKFKTLATEGNLNNHIGVPLTILSITSEIEIVIIEMGANHTGEIAMLCEIANPDYGLITNIGKAHIGEFGSFGNIVKAKSELYDFIRKKNGKVFINTENDLLMKNAEGIEKISYGNSENNFSQCEFIEANPNLKVKYENEIISSNLIGKYNFENISAAICIGKYFGIDDKKIKEAIEEYVPSNNRSQAVQTKNNSLILDAYNANPSSMQAALGNFYDMEGENKWLILGDMLELGKYETEEHATILKQIAEKKFQNVILVGERFSKAVSELKISFPNLFLFKTSDELSEKLKSDSPIKNSSLILIKGSRGMKLEKVVEFL